MRMLHPQIPRRTGILMLLPQNNSSIILGRKILQHRDGLIVRSVIDENNFKISKGLLRQAVQCIRQVLCCVISRHHN